MEIIPEHSVCNECVIILQSQAEVDEPSRDYGHKSVCLGCGVSVLRATSIAMNSNRPQLTIIRSWVPQIQADLPIFTRVCRICWRRAARVQATRMAGQAEQEIEHNILPDVSIETEDAEMPLHVNIGVQAVEDTLRPPTPPPLPVPAPEQEELLRPQRPTLALPNYSKSSLFAGYMFQKYAANTETVNTEW